MNFPIALEAWQLTKQGDGLIKRQVVHNQIEADIFIKINSHFDIRVKTVTPEELGNVDTNLLP